MSLLINGRQLETAIALQDTKHPMHEIAKEYTDGLKELKDKFGKKIKFVRPGFPRRSKGTDSRGNEAMLMELPTPDMFPLERAYPHPKRGSEIWSCCLQMPKLLPNNLWSIGNKRSIKIDDFRIVDIEKEPDLAYYLYYIAHFERGGRLMIDDPKGAIREKANKERQLVERKSAIWQMLTDENTLRKIAAAYNVANAYFNEPDQVRFDLEAKLDENDKKRGRDATIRGTKEFLEEMKVTDNVRLRAFIQKLIDDKKLVFKEGRYRLGDKALMQVPQTEDKFEWICTYYAMTSNVDKLQELMRDVIDKNFLEEIVDEKDYVWLSKCMGINTAFKKKEELKGAVYGIFNIIL